MQEQLQNFNVVPWPECQPELPENGNADNGVSTTGQEIVDKLETVFLKNHDFQMNHNKQLSVFCVEAD